MTKRYVRGATEESGTSLRLGSVRWDVPDAAIPGHALAYGTFTIVNVIVEMRRSGTAQYRDIIRTDRASSRLG
jgi:hypothetical protein